MDKIVIIDLQPKLSYDDVGGKKGLNKMGISTAGLYDYSNDNLTLFGEDNVAALIQELTSANLVLGVNLRKFVYRILSSFYDDDFSKIDTLDVLEYFKKKLSFKPYLEGLLNGTLDLNRVERNDTYTPKLYKMGKIDSIKSLCKQNISDLKMLYDFGLKKGYVFYDDKSGQRWKITVNW